MQYIVVGSGAAGISAVKELLKLKEKTDDIIVITDDKFPYYYRPRLVEILSGETSLEDIIVHDRDWFLEKGIELRVEEKLVDFDPEEKMITTSKNIFPYDKLLFASGARPFVPPIDGATKDGIFTLRYAEDALKIFQEAEGQSHAAVLGGGLLGLEAAYNLNRLNLEVSVVEVKDWLLPLQLDETGGRVLENRLEEKNLSLYTGQTAVKFAGDDGVKEVILESGTCIPAGLVLVAAGVRSNTGIYSRVSGEDCNRGIEVNKFMETGLEDVFAAGDVASFRGRFYGLWKPAVEQGRIAAGCMAGKGRGFEHSPPAHQLKVAGENVISLGNKDVKLEAEVEKASDRYRKIFRDTSGGVCGLISVGEFEDNRDLIQEIRGG
ncbi:MAG: NAD(P)/FAD-dependent oxidoreductase [Halanaerobiales bacterium]